MQHATMMITVTSSKKKGAFYPVGGYAKQLGCVYRYMYINTPRVVQKYTLVW